MVSMVQIHWEGRKRTIVTYKLIKCVDQFYDLGDYILRVAQINFCASGPFSVVPSFRPN